MRRDSSTQGARSHAEALPHVLIVDDEKRCDQIQGYLIARPQPVSDVTSLLGRKFEIPKS